MQITDIQEDTLIYIGSTYATEWYYENFIGFSARILNIFQKSEALYVRIEHPLYNKEASRLYIHYLDALPTQNKHAKHILNRGD